LAGLVGGAARFGLTGFAFAAAFQGVNELASSLRVSGDEAFTAQGKIRNFGAELLTGNIIGGFKALAAERKAAFTGDLGEKIQAELEKAKAASDPLIVTEEKLANVRQKGAEATKIYLAQIAVTGDLSEKEYQALIKVNDQLARQEAQAEATASSWASYTAQVEKAGGSLVRAFGPDSRGGLQGPGGVQAGRPTTAGTPVFQAGSGGPDVAAQIRASINSRLRDEQELATARLQEARIAQKAAQEAFRVQKANVAAGSAALNSAADEYAKLVDANTAVVNATREVETSAKAAAQHGQELGNSIRDAQAAAIADPGQEARARLRAAQIEVGQARRAFEAEKKGTAARAEAYAALRIAQAKVTGIQNEIAADAQAEAKAAQERSDAIAKQKAAAAAQRAEEHQSAVEQALANDIAIAAGTKRISDDKKAYDRAIAYYRGQARSAASDLEREQAQSTVIDLKARRKAALEKPAVDPNELRLTRLENRVAAAQLTESLADDKRAADALIAYWRQQVRDAQGLDKERARARLIAARLTRKALNDAADAEKPVTTVFDLLSKTAGRFAQFAGNLRDANNPFTRESFVGEQAQFFRRGLTSGDQLFAGPSGFTASLDNFRNRAARIPGAGLESSLEANTTATDRLTDAILNGPLVRNDKRFGKTYSPSEVVGMRYQAMGDFWKARQARAAAEAGVGAAGAGF
jgi:hypothetical protein